MKLLLFVLLALTLASVGSGSPASAQIRAAPQMTTVNPAIEAAEIARLQAKIAEQNKTIYRLRSEYADYQSRLKICAKRTGASQCIDAHTARTASGQPVDCSPYTCNGTTGTCIKTCRSSLECNGASCFNGVCK